MSQRTLYKHLTAHDFIVESIDRNSEEVQRILLHFMLLSHKRKTRYLHNTTDILLRTFLKQEWNKVKQYEN